MKEGWGGSHVFERLRVGTCVSLSFWTALKECVFFLVILPNGERYEEFISKPFPSLSVVKLCTSFLH